MTNKLDINRLLYKDDDGIYKPVTGINIESLSEASKLMKDGFIDIEEEGDDKGLIFPFQVSIGKADEPNELVVGGGDSYPVPIAFHFNYSNLIGETITGATNITDILKTDSLSSIGLFGDTIAGSAILVGSPYTFGGVKSKIVTGGVLDSNNVIGEFLSQSGLWINAPYMVTDADFKYTRKGKNLAITDNTSEQWRFGFDPDILPSPWVKVDMTINGEVLNYYWAVLRITAPITSDPILEQMKCHTNRWECNSDGVTEYFGRSRYPVSLKEGLGDTIKNSLNDPVNESVQYSSTITAAYQDNEFANGTIDGFIIPQTIVERLDTSIPLLLNISFYVKGTTGGDIKFQVDSMNVQDDFIYDGSEIADNISLIYSSPADKNLIRQSCKLKIPIDKIVSGGALLHLFRDATAGEVEDTLPHNVVITNIHLVGYFWR